MGMNVLKEHSGSIFTGHEIMEAVCSDGNISTHQSDYMRLYNFES